MIISILALFSCSPQRKAARLIERARIIDPSIVHGKQVEVEVEFPGALSVMQIPIIRERVDAVLAEIEANPQELPEIVERIVTRPILKPQRYEDDNFLIFAREGAGQIEIIVNAKPQKLTATTSTETINPTMVKRNHWGQAILLFFLGVLTGIVAKSIMR
jgi:hypothetical protein